MERIKSNKKILEEKTKPPPPKVKPAADIAGKLTYVSTKHNWSSKVMEHYWLRRYYLGRVLVAEVHIYKDIPNVQDGVFISLGSMYCPSALQRKDIKFKTREEAEQYIIEQLTAQMKENM